MSNERMVEIQKYVSDIFQTNGMAIALEAGDLINKYSSLSGQQVMEFDVGTLQADSMKLVALNFYLSTISANLEAEAQRAENIRKYEYSSEWLKAKKENEKITAGACDAIAEVKIKTLKDNEIEADKKASMMRIIANSCLETTQMLKKICEQLLITGQRA
jgi:hypothetical protein